MFANLVRSGGGGPKPIIMNKNKRGNISEAVLVEKYFQRLSNDDIRGLVDLYKIDFQMFNYSFTFRNETFI